MEGHLARRLVVGEVRAAELQQLARRDAAAGAELDGGVDALSPVRIGYSEDGGVLDGGMTVQGVLDLGRVDVHAARDDHVPLAVTDVDEALGVHPGHVAHRHPLAARGLRRGRRVAVVLVEHAVVAAHEQLAGRAGRRPAPVVVENGQLDAGRGAAARAGLAQHVLGTQHGVHAELGRAVELVEHGPEHRQRLLLHAHGARRGGDDERAHRRHVVARAHLGRQVDDALEQRGRHECRRAAMPLDEA